MLGNRKLKKEVKELEFTLGNLALEAGARFSSLEKELAVLKKLLRFQRCLPSKHMTGNQFLGAYLLQPSEFSIDLGTEIRRLKPAKKVDESVEAEKKTKKA